MAITEVCALGIGSVVNMVFVDALANSIFAFGRIGIVPIDGSAGAAFHAPENRMRTSIAVVLDRVTDNDYFGRPGDIFRSSWPDLGCHFLANIGIRGVIKPR